MILKHYLLAAALLLCGSSSTHAISRAELIKYAQTLKGKKGAELKAAVHPLLAPKRYSNMAAERKTLGGDSGTPTGIRRPTNATTATVPTNMRYNLKGQ